MTQGQLKLSDGEFWSDPFKSIDGMSTDLLMADKETFVLDAPQQVQLDKRESLPLVAFRVTSFVDCDRLPLEEAVLLGTDLTTKAGYASKAWEPEPDPYAGEDEDEGEPLDGLNAQHNQIDARAKLFLPWQESELSLRLVIRDWQSPAVKDKLSPPKPAYEDPEVAKFLAEQAQGGQQEPPAPVWPPAGARLPRYGSLEADEEAGLPAGLEIPSEPGVSLTLPRVVVASEDASALLNLSWRLPLRPAERVPPPAEGEEPAAEAPPAPTAIQAITLVVVGSEFTGPERVVLRVPSWDEIGEDTQSVSGQAQLDFMQVALQGRESQTHFVYVLAGEVSAGPFPIALVSEQQVRDAAR